MTKKVNRNLICKTPKDAEFLWNKVFDYVSENDINCDLIDTNECSVIISRIDTNDLRKLMDYLENEFADEFVEDWRTKTNLSGHVAKYSKKFETRRA